jgi:hypothetical protein
MRLALLVLLFSTSAGAQSLIRVPADVPTIQGAITLAQDGDTVLVASGTYNETIEYLGKAITVESESGAVVTTIDGTGLFDTVVRFAGGEGPSSILKGFTVTGGNAGSRTGGLDAVGARPRVEACIIRGNRTQGSLGAGASGDMALIDCLIEDNHGTLAAAGGVWGAGRLVRCIVRGNSGYDAGGIQLNGGRAKDCVITGNTSAEGTYGGGVNLSSASAVLERCLVFQNTAVSFGMYPVSSAGVYVSPTAQGALILNCTIADNVVVSPYVPPGENGGGVQGPALLVNTIVRGNDELEIGLQATVQAFYCDIEGGYPGLGNFDLDPLFVDRPNGDYHLQVGSPCVDAGAPQAPLDPDQTRADVGAFHLPQAHVIERNGMGVNPLLLSSVTPPRIGMNWQARIDSSLVLGATLSVITVRTNALDPGLLVPQGELLVDGFELVRAVAPSSGGPDDFSLPIPGSIALVGRVVHAQGYVVLGPRVRLGNALAVHFGH